MAEKQDQPEGRVTLQPAPGARLVQHRPTPVALGNERPLKRKRASSDPNGRPPRRNTPIPRFGAPKTLHRDSEFWFDDGSIILIAAGDVGFRVYKRLLAEHSPFFRDMFSMPQPVKGPTIEGCPLVYLADPPAQLRHLLRVIFPSSGHLTFGKPHTVLTMDAISAVIHLAHKYQVDQVLAQALSHLTEYYTDSFDEWIKPDRDASLTFVPEPLDSISAIYLAHITQTPSILPLAYLQASQVRSHALYGMLLREEAWVDYLSQSDAVCIIDGGLAATRACSKALARIFSPRTSLHCHNTRRCTQAFVANLVCLEEKLEVLYAEGMATSWYDLFDEEEDLCTQCREMVQSRDIDERRAFWKSLPKLFRLNMPDWKC